ncbi:hypothetical protein N2152v2_006204 [Parachlorella kessleri]
MQQPSKKPRLARGLHNSAAVLAAGSAGVSAQTTSGGSPAGSTSPPRRNGVPCGPLHPGSHAAASLSPRCLIATAAAAEPDIVTPAADEHGAAAAEGASLPATAGVAPGVNTLDGAEQQQLDVEPGQEQQQQQQQPRPKKVLVMPTPILPPEVPLDEGPWQNGVLLVDKPKTWTSFDVCAKIRGALKRIQVKKVGHAGTLDPMATGLLIVCVGRGTKAVDAFMAMTKEYTGVLRLGEGTPSYDADTEVSQRLPWEHITDEQLLAARERLVGEIQQVPPMFSAIRLGGKRLYEVARMGGEVERQPRTVTVEAFELERDPQDPQSVRFRVVCSKGTYVRSLAHDLGAALGTAAHLTALRREAIGEYRVQDAWQVQELTDQLVAQKKGGRGLAKELLQGALPKTQQTEAGGRQQEEAGMEAS